MPNLYATFCITFTTLTHCCIIQNSCQARHNTKYQGIAELGVTLNYFITDCKPLRKGLWLVLPAPVDAE